MEKGLNMGMSDCPKCWDTPCTCGHDYRGWSLDKLLEFRDMIDEVIAEKRSEKPKSSKKTISDANKHYFDDDSFYRNED